MWRALALAACLRVALPASPAWTAGEDSGASPRPLGEVIQSLCEPAGLRFVVDGEMADIPVAEPGAGAFHERLDAVCACIPGGWWSREGRTIAVGRRPSLEPRMFCIHTQAQRLDLLARFANALSHEEREALRQGLGIAFDEMGPAAQAVLQSDPLWFGPITGEPGGGVDPSVDFRGGARVVYTRWEDRVEFYAHPSDVKPVTILQRISPGSSGLIRFNSVARKLEGTPWFADAYVDRSQRLGVPVPSPPRAWQPGDNEPGAPVEAVGAPGPVDDSASAILPFGLLPLRDILETLSPLGVPLSATAEVEDRTILQPGGEWSADALTRALEPVLRLRPRRAGRGLVFEGVPLTPQDYDEGVAPELSGHIVDIGSRVAGDAPRSPDLRRHKMVVLPAEARRELAAIYRWWATQRDPGEMPPDPDATPNMEVRFAPTVMICAAWFSRAEETPREFDEGAYYYYASGLSLYAM